MKDEEKKLPSVHASIVRNAHLAKFIKTLNKIKIKIGLYTIVSGNKFY